MGIQRKLGLKNSGSLAVIAATLLVATVAASAQQTNTETVVVTGIRGSLQSAMDTKRNANQVVDSISAEDIGKFPDKDIGEALQRVTGVQINRSSGGEGSTVTVRGGDPSLTRVEINGVGALSVTPNSGDRAVDFRDLPVEFVQRLEVVKSPTADMTEGGIGGTVRVITRRPFDSKEPFIAGSAEGVNASLPKTTDGKFALIGSKLFFNDTLGVLISGEYAQAHEYDGQALTTGWLRQNVNNAAATTGASFANGQGAPANPLGSDFNNDGTFDWYPQIPRYFNNRRTTLRKALNSAVEFRPNDDFKFFWDLTFASGRENVHNQALQLNDQGGVFDYAHTTVGADNTVTHIEETSNGVARATGANNIPGTLPLDLTYRDILGFLTREQLTTSVGASYNVTPELTIDGRVDFGRARVDNEETDSTATLFGMSQQLPGARSSVDYANPLHAPNIQFPGLDVTKSAGINNLDAVYTPVINTTTERTEALNAKYRPAGAEWLELKVGGLRHDYKVIETSYTKHATLTCRGSVSSGTTVVVPTTCGTITGIIDSTATVNSDPFYSTGNLGITTEVRNWLDLNQKTVIATEAAANSNIYDLSTTNPNVGPNGTCFSNASTGCTFKNYLANWSVQEGTTDVYGMASFDFPNFRWPVSGNVGLRYVSSHTGSTGYSQNTNPTTQVVTFQQTTINGQYQQYLPSANLKVDIIPDELIARFAAGEVMARPAPSQLALNRTLDIVGHTGRSGNPGLLPFLSTDYDAGLEWYFNKLSFVSVGYFNKEISRFIQSNTSTFAVDDGTGALVNYSIQSFSNNNVPVTINGLEINVQYAFDWLPEPFDGLGILANYTSQSDTGFNTKNLIDGSSLSFPGLSRTAYNYSLYYEKYGFSLRTSYVWRSRWLINAAGRGNLPEFNDSYGEVDLSASYAVTPEISVFTDVINLTDEQLEQENAPARPISFDTFGQRIFFGVRAKF